METVGFVLAFVGMSWLLSFVAALLLCSPGMFRRLPRRARFRLPSADEARVNQEARTTPQVDSRGSRNVIWSYLLVPIVVPMMIPILVLCIVPAFAAMWLAAVGMNFRYLRRTTFRALRQKRAMLASCRSYPVAVALFVRRVFCPKRGCAPA